jgi:protein-tyrosine phosphatase
MVKILFVCLGNICRSPLAEAVFCDYLKKKELSDSKVICDSAGTASYHIGSKADIRTRNNARNHGIDITHKARSMDESDFNNFDFIIAMDEKNLSFLKKMQAPNSRAQLFLMRQFEQPNPMMADVPDPYYGNELDFEEVFQIVSRCCNGLYQQLVLPNV